MRKTGRIISLLLELAESNDYCHMNLHAVHFPSIHAKAGRGRERAEVHEQTSQQEKKSANKLSLSRLGYHFFLMKNCSFLLS
jgi:hypothetical protein